jgi:hypothetical protein
VKAADAVAGNPEPAAATRFTANRPQAALPGFRKGRITSRIQAEQMNERAQELYREILGSLDGEDAVQAITALSMALAALILHAATEGKVPALTADVVRNLEMNVREMHERAGSPPSQIVN